jgi:TPR repeat protein
MFRRRIRMPGLWVAALCLLLQLGGVISKEAAPAQKSNAAAGSRSGSDRSQIKDAAVVVVEEEDPFTKRTLDEARARVRAALAQSASGESPTINTKAVLSSYQMAAVKGKGKLALNALDELASFHMVRAQHSMLHLPCAPPVFSLSLLLSRGQLPKSYYSHLTASSEQNGNATLGVARDPRQALAFLDRAAGAHGSPNAQHLMAVAYATGTST